MPCYEFLCESCGLQFEKMKRMSEWDDPEPCPECQTSAPKIPSVTNHTFKHPASQTRGMAPPNTGTSDDHNYDKIIGRDAEKSWNLIRARQDYKRSVIRDNPGSTGADLTRTHDGEYKVMKPSDRKIAETGRAIGSAVVSAAKTSTASPKKPKT